MVPSDNPARILAVLAVWDARMLEPLAALDPPLGLLEVVAIGELLGALLLLGPVLPEEPLARALGVALLVLLAEFVGGDLIHFVD